MIRVTTYVPVRFFRWKFTFPIFRKLPENWSECTQLHYLLIVKSLVLSTQPFDEEWTEKTQINVLRNLLRLPKMEFDKLTDLQVSLLISRMSGIMQNPPTTWPKPYFKIGFKKYWWPKSIFDGMTTGEFAIAEVFYRQIAENRNAEKSLDLLIGYLARPAGQPISTEMAQRTARDINYSDILHKSPIIRQLHMIWRSLTYIEKFAFYYYYYLNRCVLVEKYPNVFKKSNDDKADFTSGYGWHGLIYAIADNGAFGTEKEIKTGDLHDFLNYVNFNIDRMKEQEWNNRYGNPYTTR